MSTDTQKYSDEVERELSHSAFEEFSRDERRPAVLLLAGLVIAALFFALGLMFGRWTEKPGSTRVQPAGQPGQSAPANRTTATPTPSPSRPNPIQ